MNNTINFTQHVLKKDLEAYSAALFELTQKLMIENQELKEKLKHLEELLVGNTYFPTLKVENATVVNKNDMLEAMKKSVNSTKSVIRPESLK